MSLTPNGEPAPKSRRRRALLWILVVAVLAGGGYVAYDKLIKDDKGSGGEVSGTGVNDFTLTFPAGWTPLTRKELETLPGRPIAVIRQKNGKGFFVLRVKGPAPATFTKFSGDLSAELKKRIKDFQEQSSRTIEVKAGKAFFYSYIRKKKGTVHKVVVVPAGNKSYVINTVSAGGEKKIAKEVVNMIISFNNK
ncbi:MAG: hypothetical protein WDZ37_02545 [Solirubrobacterales bacterium]